MASLAELLRQGADTITNLPTEAQRFMYNPQAFMQMFGVNKMPNETGFAEGAMVGDRKYGSEKGFKQGEPFALPLAVASIGAPLAVPAAKALAPKAAQMAENYLTKVGGINYVLPPQKYVGKTLEGMPNTVKVGDKMEQFGTDQRLVDIAQRYAQDKGLTYNPLTTYSQIDTDRAKRLALAYQLMKNEPNNPAVKKAYSSMIDETMDQYDALRKQGYKFDFMPQSGDIYGNPRNAINDVVTNKRLSVFPTIQGFGGPSAAIASEANPLLMKTGEKWSGQDVTANDVFRAVHDVFGHAKHGVGFRAGGEENAFQAHARMYSPRALPAATSETRGQNSWVNFGPYGEKNRAANPLLTEYAEQKTGIMPAWTYLEGIAK